jgi:hypothetical protein
MTVTFDLDELCTVLAEIPGFRCRINPMNVQCRMTPLSRCRIWQ